LPAFDTISRYPEAKFDISICTDFFLRVLKIFTKTNSAHLDQNCDFTFSTKNNVKERAPKALALQLVYVVITFLITWMIKILYIKFTML